MVDKATFYSLFQSEHRGSEVVERKLEALMSDMQTPENLKKLGRAISVDCWSDKNTKSGQMNFSRFEEKLNRAKQAHREGKTTI